MSVTLTTTIPAIVPANNLATNQLLKPVNQNNKKQKSKQTNQSSSLPLPSSPTSTTTTTTISATQDKLLVSDNMAEKTEEFDTIESTTTMTNRFNNHKGEIKRKTNNNQNHNDDQFIKDSNEKIITDEDIIDTTEANNEEVDKEFKAELVWRNIILFIILHTCLPISIYIMYTQRPLKTMIYGTTLVYLSGLGVTAGTHRLWSHKAYKANRIVEIFLIILQTCAGQNSAYTWSRDHRVHHKFSETNADPHNIKRGFFFAHMGWLCCKKHPDVIRKGKQVDMSDLAANPVVAFQHKHFWWMAILFSVVVPVAIPVLCWGERFWTSFVLTFMLRYIITLHGTWLVNSAAHYHGDRPYDERIEARESPFVIATGLGEGFHNYHHTFPYDYSTSEFGKYFNITTAFIDSMAAIGFVKDRRSASAEIIAQRRKRTGDKTLDNVQTSERSALGTIIQDLPYVSGLTSMRFTM